MVMNDERDEKLDLLMQKRAMVPPSSGLAQRIILRAQQVPQRKTVSLWQSIRDICAEFHLPKPAYVLAGALAIGLLIGFSAPQNIETSANDAVAVQNFLSADETVL